MISDPHFYLAAIPAVILMGLAKGGFAGIGMLGVPMLALVVSPVQGAAITLPILMVQDAISIAAYWKKWDTRNILILMPGAIIGIIIGYLLAAKVSDGPFYLALGFISVVFGLRSLFAANLTPKKAGIPAGLFWGVAAGFTSMIANAGAPPFQLYVLPQRLARDIFVGTSIAFFAIVNWIKLPGFWALGQFTEQNMLTTAVLIPLAVVSTWAGVWLVRRTSNDRFYKIIYGLMVLVGLKLMHSGIELIWL
ncbi:UPF0721 transmembrane protein [Terrihabitans soli]|uniref:Probable membrane transporter protein n=1 Tax=Terrihabitans soli TaxID=708113 RepID=A0A6S6QSI5_9HYPH|nr:sulfite exporter TauE/SafE family protein [Terrihabitans soli]BCJ89870.1 UPF0721 transmembrane protein [Terrihabitans soli]